MLGLHRVLSMPEYFLGIPFTLHAFLYKQQFYKQRQAKIGKK